MKTLAVPGSEEGLELACRISRWRCRLHCSAIRSTPPDDRQSRRNAINSPKREVYNWTFNHSANGSECLPAISAVRDTAWDSSRTRKNDFRGLHQADVLCPRGFEAGLLAITSQLVSLWRQDLGSRARSGNGVSSTLRPTSACGAGGVGSLP